MSVISSEQTANKGQILWKHLKKHSFPSTESEATEISEGLIPEQVIQMQDFVLIPPGFESSALWG